MSLVWTGWDGEHKGSFLVPHPFATVAVGYNVVLDFVIIILPIRALLGLKLDFKKKFGILCIFIIGIL